MSDNKDKKLRCYKCSEYLQNDATRYECPECGEWFCEHCIDEDSGMCRACRYKVSGQLE